MKPKDTTMSGELDTSGAVEILGSGGKVRRGCLWSDLSPFEQGYIEALFADWQRTDWPYWAPLGFSDLSPEALAAIRKDCGLWQAIHTDIIGNRLSREGGASFWQQRQENWPAWPLMRDRFAVSFPPVSPSLTEEGRVITVSVAESGSTASPKSDSHCQSEGGAE
jgi:hypothetical protein